MLVGTVAGCACSGALYVSRHVPTLRVCLCLSLSLSLCVCVHLAHAFSLSAHSAGWQEHRAASWPNAAVPAHNGTHAADQAADAGGAPTGSDNITGACNIGSYACCRYGGSRWGRIECLGIIHSAAEHNALAGARTQAPFTLCTEGEELTIEQSQILGLLKYKTATFKPELHCKWWGGEFKIY